MSGWYLETSAAAKLLVEEDESGALATDLDSRSVPLRACHLLETELRRLAARVPGLSQESVTHVLDGVDLHEVPPSLFREAGLLPGENLRSLDALHLAAAVRLGVSAVVTYDAPMAAGARGLGLAVHAPAP